MIDQYYIARIGANFGDLIQNPNTPRNCILIKPKNRAEFVRMKVAYLAGEYEPFKARQSNITRPIIREIMQKAERITSAEVELISGMLIDIDTLETRLAYAREDLKKQAVKIWN